MPRPTMTALIRRLRRAIGDPDGPGAFFSDDDLQDFLDVARSEARYQPLTPLQSVAPGGAVQWLIFCSEWGDWEDGAELVDVGFNVLAPASADLLTGRWQFAQSVTPGVMLSGFTYDVAWAAVEALESWAGDVKMKYDFARADQKLSRSQMLAGLLSLAETYRGKCRPVVVSFRRDDLTGA